PGKRRGGGAGTPGTRRGASRRRPGGQRRGRGAVSRDRRAVHLPQWVLDELQALAVGALEVERRAARLLRDNPRGFQLGLEVLPPLGLHRDREVVQTAEHLGVHIEVQSREVEERKEVAVADVEEEVGGTLVVA